ncbi:hypothetical protein Acsp02_93110 [Actinoplanes sp. NBRC 103695]|nr:hypothetical protein Acsp02_93110 [Actinoplanes sp. NBRC 103695]
MREDQSKAARIDELNATIRYTMWSVSRAESPPPALREDLTSEVNGLFRFESQLLFQVLTEREEKATVAVASNEAFLAWSSQRPCRIGTKRADRSADTAAAVATTNPAV